LLVQEPEVLEGWAMELEGRSDRPLQLAWSTHQEESGPSSSERENDQDVIASDPLVVADSVVLNDSSVNNPPGGDAAKLRRAPVAGPGNLNVNMVS
jgi:hypothetical protein